MSVAEYIASFISIMVGLALADLATSLQRLLRAGGHVRWDIFTPASAVLVTAFVINVWWAMFGALNSMGSISVAAFIPDLISLVLLFCLASSVLPDDLPERGDLAAYYDENRKRFWTLFVTYTLWVTAVIAVRGSLGGKSGADLIGSIVPNLLLSGLMLLLLWTPRRVVHLIVVALLLAISATAWLPQELR